MCGESPLPVFTRNRWLSKEIFSNKHPVAKRGAQIYMCRTCLTVLAFLSKPISPPLSNKSVKCSVGITNHVGSVQTARSVVYTVCLVRFLLLGRIRSKYLAASGDFYHCKQFGPRSRPTKRRVRSGSKLFDTLRIVLK